MHSLSDPEAAGRLDGLDDGGVREPGDPPDEARPPDIATQRERLRRDYNPLGWLVLFDGRTTWSALHAEMPTIRARTPIGLRSALDAVVTEHQGHARTRS